MSDVVQQRLHAFVFGRVQGVGFRHFVRLTASSLSLSGWVRNRRDGSVEVVAEGDRQLLEQLLSALQQGPGSANVRDVDTDWSDAKGEFNQFNVKMTL